MKRVACYCMTRNLYHKVRPSLNSLLKNTSVDHVYILAEDDDIGFELPEKVSLVNVADQKFFDPEGPNYRSRWTYMCLMRIPLCYIFPDLDRILTLDVDTIVDKNIDDIWDTPFEQCYFAGVKEEGLSHQKNRPYINFGVVLWNLKKMRDGMADRIIQELNTRFHMYPEQDVANDMCQRHIYQISSVYNSCRFTAPTNYPKIHHFAATGLWYEHHPLVQKYKEGLV